MALTGTEILALSFPEKLSPLWNLEPSVCRSVLRVVPGSCDPARFPQAPQPDLLLRPEAVRSIQSLVGTPFRVSLGGVAAVSCLGRS